MAATPPTIEPLVLTVGDTWTWTRNLPDYDSATWTLTYSLVPTTGTVITITATGSGNDYTVDVPAATTATYAAKDYLMVGTVTDGTDRFQVYRQDVTVYPNILSPYDSRTYWETIRDQARDILDGNSQRRDISYSKNGFSMTAKSDADLLELISYAESRIANERSQGRNRKVLIRFRGA